MKSLIDQLGPHYQFKDSDAGRGWDIMLRYFSSREKNPPTPEELGFARFAVRAGWMHQQNSKYPTVAEVAADFDREREEWSKRNPGCRDCFR